MTTYVLKYARAYNNKGTPYHWVCVYKPEEMHSRVFAIRAWGKRPSQVKSMAFNGVSQARNYYNKWKDGKTFTGDENPEEMLTADNPEEIIKHMLQSFTWIDMLEHQATFDEAMGIERDPSVVKEQARVQREVKNQSALQRLPATYGWW